MRGRWRSSLGAAVLALALGVYAKLQFGEEKTAELGTEVASFMIIGDWGGTPGAPYTTPGQLAAAAAMAKVAVAQLATFVVSPGGNFYGGLQGATRCELPRLSAGRGPAAPDSGCCWGGSMRVMHAARMQLCPVAARCRGVAPLHS